MKKAAGLIFLLLALTLVFSGCESKTETATENKTPDQAVSGPAGQTQPPQEGDAGQKPVNPPSNTASGPAGQTQPPQGSDSEKTPVNPPSGTDRPGQIQSADLRGEISAVSGNQVTLKLIKQPAGGGNRPSEGQGQNQSQTKPPGGEAQPQMPAQSRSQPPEMTLEYSGETKTITIPDDVAITTMSRSNQGMETKKITVKELKEGDILQVWYSDQEKERISRVSIIAKT